METICFSIQIMHRQPGSPLRKINLNQMLFLLGVGMDDRMGNLGILFPLWMGMDDWMGNLRTMQKIRLATKASC